MPSRNKLGIIGGSGLTSLAELELIEEKTCTTPYGEPSSRLILGRFHSREVIFLARHGNPHLIPPHRVNYRANLWALRDNGAEQVIAVNAVGGISADMEPTKIVIPDQIIDYTWGRQHTYFEEGQAHVIHVDFTHPYSEALRGKIISAAHAAGIDVISPATYGATQGPRLESAAEIRRMHHDGCHIVGMTGMPEAGLARELALEYASICLVVNWAAGTGDAVITMDEIEENLNRGMNQVMFLLGRFIEYEAGQGIRSDIYS